jgi:uncharacterized protein YodC (DUF2158 family)
MNKLYQILASIINPKSKSVDEKIVIGTIVHLKSGGFNMTVQDIAIGDKYVNNECLYRKGDFLCRWATKDGRYDEKWFSANTVKPK